MNLYVVPDSAKILTLPLSFLEFNRIWFVPARRHRSSRSVNLNFCIKVKMENLTLEDQPVYEGRAPAKNLRYEKHFRCDPRFSLSQTFGKVFLFLPCRKSCPPIYIG